MEALDAAQKSELLLKELGDTRGLSFLQATMQQISDELAGSHAYLIGRGFTVAHIVRDQLRVRTTAVAMVRRLRLTA